VPAISSDVVCVVIFANSFARRQHLFDIVAKPIDVDSNILSYLLILLPCSCSDFAQNVII